MRIIINADDFGYDADTVESTIACFREGSITSATIMVKMPASDAAIAFARSNSQFSYGVHLTFLTDQYEHPVTSPQLIRSLLTAQGTFWPSQVARRKALLRRLAVRDICREMAAQIATLANAGIPVSHIDSHGHLHKFSVFRRALKLVLPEFGISKVRTVQDIYITPRLRSPTYWMGRIWRSDLTRSFQTTDHLYLPSGDQGDWTRRLLSLTSGESLEIGIHPGQSEAWRSLERQSVHRFVSELDLERHRLIRWTDL